MGGFGRRWGTLEAASGLTDAPWAPFCARNLFRNSFAGDFGARFSYQKACSSPDLLTKIGSGAKHAFRVGERFIFETQGVHFRVEFR